MQRLLDDINSHINRLAEQSRREGGHWGYEDPNEVMWHCKVCGEDPAPRYLQKIGLYMKGPCLCKRTYWEKCRKEHNADIQKQVMHEHQRWVYGWLGPAEFARYQLLRCTFDNFKVELEPTAYAAALSFAFEMCEENPRAASFILHGYKGTGKTHLISAICQHIYAHGKNVRFCTAPDLFRAIGYRIGRGEEYGDIIMKAIKADLWVLDDVDKAFPSDFRLETYWQVIDARTIAGRPIAISTNKLDMLEHFLGETSADRLEIGRMDVPTLSLTSFRKQL